MICRVVERLYVHVNATILNIALSKPDLWVQISGVCNLDHSWIQRHNVMKHIQNRITAPYMLASKRALDVVSDIALPKSR